MWINGTKKSQLWIYSTIVFSMLAPIPVRICVSSIHQESNKLPMLVVWFPVLCTGFKKRFIHYSSDTQTESSSEFFRVKSFPSFAFLFLKFWEPLYTTTQYLAWNRLYASMRSCRAHWRGRNGMHSHTSNSVYSYVTELLSPIIDDGCSVIPQLGLKETSIAAPGAAKIIAEWITV